MPNQTFNFESQKGTLRRYKDSDTKQIFIYDIVSGRVHIGEETGMSIPGLNEMINANCKKSWYLFNHFNSVIKLFIYIRM